MIKKILLTLGVVLTGLINFSFGYLEFNTNEGFTLNGNTFVIDEKLNFLDTKYVGYSNSCGYGNLPNMFFRTDEGLAFYNSTNPAGLLIYSGYCLVSQYNSGYYDNNLTNCNEILPIENLFNQNLTFKKIVFNGINEYNGCMVWTQDGFSSNIAFVDTDDNAYIFPRAGGIWSNYSEWGYSLINTNDNRDNIIDEYAIELSPFNGGGGSDGGFNGNVEISNDDIVSYYEDTRGFNYNMCFVGTWDFTQNEGTFKQGNGEHIFSYFNWFYNLGTGNNATGYKLSDVGKFIDEMYGNYDIYFNYGNRYGNGDIAYIYKFNINTHILDWVDTGYNNPFEENTYVYTFYPKILHYYTDYWRLYYYGGDLANYCYYKLNLNNSPQEDIYGDLQNDISQEDLNNIGDWKIISSNIKSSQSGNVLSVSENWSGSPIDYFVQENLSGSYEDFDAGTFFTDSFNRFKGVFGELNPSDFGFGYLPGYIITFMLAFILFRFLSH